MAPQRREWNRLLAKADPTIKTLHHALPFAETAQCFIGAAREKPEIARIAGNRRFTVRVHQMVECAPRRILHRTLAFVGSDAIDDLISLVEPAMDERIDHGKGMLEIRVHHHNRIGLHQIETGSQRDLFAEIAAEPDHPHSGAARTLGKRRLQAIHAIIAAAVVDENRIDGNGPFSRRGFRVGIERIDHRFEIQRFVVKRNDKRDRLAVAAAWQGDRMRHFAVLHVPHKRRPSRHAPRAV